MRRLPILLVLTIAIPAVLQGSPLGASPGSPSRPRLAAARLDPRALPPRSARHPASGPKGHLLVVGGNGMTDDIRKKAVDTAGGQDGLVVVVPQASELPETGKEDVAAWLKAGMGRGLEIDLRDVPAAIDALGRASFIWFSGGDQEKLMKLLQGTGIPEAVRARHAQGALVGGTSAGAAAMSRLMMTGNADLQSITAGTTELVPGLGLWPEVIVDQHFLKRQRSNRLVSAVLDHADLVGVGIDETTAVFVTGRRFEVLGRSSVVVVDARRAKVDAAPARGLATGRGLKISVLKAGMGFDLDGDR